jgi:cysteine-rich repeat protein
MSHRWLIAVSLTAHFAVAGGLFAAGVWRIDRMDSPHGRTHLDVWQPAPPPAPAGGSVAVKIPEFQHKEHKTIPHDRTQPPIVASIDTKADTTTDIGDIGGGGGSGDPDAVGTCTENCDKDAPPAAAVCGNGSVEAGEQCDDGNALNGDGCSSTCRIEVRPRPTAIVAPSVLQGLRLSGDTQVHPSNSTQTLMVHDGATQVAGTIKLCLGTDGGVARADMLISTKYADYDAALLRAVHGWRYQPYRLNGVAVPACSTVRFLYSLR